MSIKALLHISGHVKETEGIEIYSCDFSFSQETDIQVDSSTSIVRAGLINLTMRSVNDPEIVHWMFQRFAYKNGKISFLEANESGIEQEYKSLKFENGILVNYTEHFTYDSEMILKLSILARRISLSDNEYKGSLDTDEIG